MKNERRKGRKDQEKTVLKKKNVDEKEKKLLGEGMKEKRERR